MAKRKQQRRPSPVHRAFFLTDLPARGAQRALRAGTESLDRGALRRARGGRRGARKEARASRPDRCQGGCQLRRLLRLVRRFPAANRPHKEWRSQRLPPLLQRSLCFCFYRPLRTWPWLSPFSEVLPGSSFLGSKIRPVGGALPCDKLGHCKIQIRNNGFGLRTTTRHRVGGPRGQSGGPPEFFCNRSALSLPPRRRRRLAIWTRH